ncbi:glycosyltransferase [Clostridium perfringens]
MNEIKVSVIIPVYNVEKYIKRCIDSLNIKKNVLIEYIFINDGSTDDSLNRLKECTNYYNNVLILNQNNSGVSSARNLGINLAKGEFIGFIDPDDTVNYNMFNDLYNVVTYTNSEMAICNHKVIWENNSEIKKFSNINGDKDNILNEVINEFVTNQFDGYIWNKLYKTDIIRKNKIQFDESITMQEDILFNLQYLNYVNSIAYIDKPLYNYYQISNSAIRKKHNNLLYGSLKLYKYTEILAKKYNKNIDIKKFRCGKRILDSFCKDIEYIVYEEKNNNRVKDHIYNIEKNEVIISCIKQKKLNKSINQIIIINLAKLKNIFLLRLYLKAKNYCIKWKG